MKTVMLYDGPKRDMSKCMDCESDSDWIIFGCLPFCDACLPEHHRKKESKIDPPLNRNKKDMKTAQKNEANE